MQEREKTRCKSDMAYHCATHDTQKKETLEGRVDD